MKILLIDDSDVIRQAYKYLLEKNGHDVIAAVKGETGLAGLKENPDIDLVIVDLNLPDMNGLQVIEQINKSEINVKKWLMTTQVDTDCVVEANKIGAEYVNKIDMLKTLEKSGIIKI